MPTISVSEDVKRELLKFASELQMKLGRVDFDEAIRFLLMYRRKKNPRLLIEACTSGDVEDALKELYEEGKMLAIDAGVIIELLLQSKAGIAIRNALLDEIVDAHTTKIAITEVKYILCRKFGWKESCKRVEKLLSSGYLSVYRTDLLIDLAAKYKCERGISLADCFVLALAKKLGCKALFARRDQELVKEMDKKKFNIEILFLEDFV